MKNSNKKAKKFLTKLKTIYSTFAKYGFLRGLVKILHSFFEAMEWRLNRKADLKEKKRKEEVLIKSHKKIDDLINDEKYKYIFVFYPYTEWNLPIFQRPQQIALALTESREDVLYFFCTSNYLYDHVDYIEGINRNLYITTEYKYIMKAKTNKRILHLYSTDIISKINDINNSLKHDKILYEYIDEIHEDITHSISPDYIKKHEYVLKHEECYIVTTADKLYEDVKKIRKSKYILSTNGVKVEDFILDKKSSNIPKELVKLKSEYKAIIGYYGALAKWFDYELLGKLASKYKEYVFVLIGIEYDKSLKQSKVLEKYNNIKYIGKVDYNKLVYYAKNMDVLTIPFLINDVTKSTSPVKLFEYMALQKPIITTDLPECRKYKSVNIAKTHDEFIEKLPKIINLNKDEEYKTLELKEAYENSWTHKSNDIINLLKS